MSKTKYIEKMISEMPIDKFWEVICDFATTREYAKAFNHGVKSLTPEERKKLEKALEEYGIPIPLNDLELLKAIESVTQREMTCL